MTSGESLAVPTFRVRCHAEGSGHFEVTGTSAALRVGQRIHYEGRAQLWDPLRVECREREDGSLEIDVLVCHPAWQKPVRIARIASAASTDENAPPALEIELPNAQAANADASQSEASQSPKKYEETLFL
jgi:hypothetical protein